MAAVAGLLLGGAMKPNLRGDDRPEGPQIFAGWSGVRSTGPFDPGMTFADYQGQIPDYVVGTDWKAAYAWRDDIAYEPAPVRDYYEESREQPREYARSDLRWQEPPRAEPLYPSISGGVAYEASARVAEAPPPPPPPEEAHIDDDAPPEATGDTSPAV
ncbi:hypothetical protein [Phenylobacterium sp.]|jgi:hypothetical protein|uniref:hypothetical protein n=1 Tax=Phenylobacterium sp. TaxID=1871053 RepID=UPI002F93E5A0